MVARADARQIGAARAATGVRRCPARRTRSGAPGRTDAIRSPCSRSRAPPGCPSCCPSATAAWRESPFAFFRGAAAVMAMDLATTPTTGHAGAGVRRRPRDQLRAVRHARAQPDLRHQRLRRDPARAVGVGRQAPVRQPARRRSPARASPTAKCDELVMSAARTYREVMADVVGAAGPRALVRPHPHRAGHRPLPAPVPAAGEARREEVLPQDPPSRRGQADQRGRRRRPVRGGPAAAWCTSTAPASTSTTSCP